MTAKFLASLVSTEGTSLLPEQGGTVAINISIREGHAPCRGRALCLIDMSYTRRHQTWETSLKRNGEPADGR